MKLVLGLAGVALLLLAPAGVLRVASWASWAALAAAALARQVPLPTSFVLGAAAGRLALARRARRGAVCLLLFGLLRGVAAGDGHGEDGGLDAAGNARAQKHGANTLLERSTAQTLLGARCGSEARLEQLPGAPQVAAVQQI